MLSPHTVHIKLSKVYNNNNNNDLLISRTCLKSTSSKIII